MIDNRTGNAKIESMLRKAVVKMIREDSTFGYFLLSTQIIIKEEKMDTVFTNGKYIVVPDNKEVEALLEKHTANTVLKHEALHMIFAHTRRGRKYHNDFEKFELCQAAAEVLVNENMNNQNPDIINFNTIQQSLGIRIPDTLETIKKMTLEEFTEYLYNLIKKSGKSSKSRITSMVCSLKGIPEEEVENNSAMPKQSAKKEKEDKKDSKSKSSSKKADWKKDYHLHIQDDYSDKEAEGNLDKEMKDQGFVNAESLIQNKIKEALMRGKIAGKGTSGIWKSLEDMYFKPKVDWKNTLYQYLKTYKDQEDIKGRKFVNRRYYQLENQIQNLPLMFMHKKRVLEGVYVAIDTSGSISDPEYLEQVGEVLELIKNENVKGKILLFDDGIRKTFDMSEDWKSLKIKLMSRTYGGTDFRPLYEEVSKKKGNLLIILSDLYASYPNQRKWNFPALFITHLRNKSPAEKAKEFGKVIFIQSDKNEQ